MQFDEQQNVDPAGQDTSFDPYRQATGDQMNDLPGNVGNTVPGGQPYTGQAQQTGGQGFDPLQAQGQQDMSQAQPGMGGLGETLQQQSQPGIGGMGDMLGNQANQPGQMPPVQPTSASADPNNPYGNVDDVIANYGNTQGDQGQQGVTNV